MSCQTSTLSKHQKLMGAKSLPVITSHIHYINHNTSSVEWRAWKLISNNVIWLYILCDILLMDSILFFHELDSILAKYFALCIFSAFFFISFSLFPLLRTSFTCWYYYNKNTARRQNNWRRIWIFLSFFKVRWYELLEV